MKKIFILALLLPLTGCAGLLESLPFVGNKQKLTGGVYKENLNEERVVDLSIVRKVTGEKRFFILPKYTFHLEGYIRGVVVDYDDNPIEGVVVRAKEGQQDMPGFDPGVSDMNGVYRVRFSLPIVKNRVDQSGTLSYNSPWEQQLSILGATLEPQTKSTKFRLFYDQKLSIVGIGEDSPKTITRKVTQAERSVQESEKKKRDSRVSPPEQEIKPQTQQPPAPPATQNPKKGYDFFGGFGDSPQ